ncbi:unnamed protein product [Rotaria magnacalcarata]|uniref:Homeobox domain-containing protein n=1 Tax=Rotaria magnacalcarata TaxID=392030 RepID=A0A816ZKM3_9BILA|nr:unnamed protein product [Rotaria magnacalcarata]CAF2126487.1 unnamed protein product [Rotaria magnacalcarata]CAF2197980.1 unnamed protein product [Rotaria magnacalcarata]
MLKLGFSMEELMFPENYQSNLLIHFESNCLREKLRQISSTYDYQESMIVDNKNDDDDDDWFTIKQLNPEISLNSNSLINDQTLSVIDIFSDNCHLGQVKSMFEFDRSIGTLLLPNLANQLIHDKNNALLSSDTIPIVSSFSPCDQRQSATTTTITQQQSNKYTMSKSTSSLSFCTQSSTSMISSSADEISSNSNDVNELTTIHHATESMRQLSDHYKHNRTTSDDSLNLSSRRRRKRTIFSAADIEHLKDSFIQNPKPSQQDIAVLSDQLGHDSYVIRVWFYNKRQATKKRNE